MAAFHHLATVEGGGTCGDTRSETKRGRDGWAEFPPEDSGSQLLGLWPSRFNKTKRITATADSSCSPSQRGIPEIHPQHSSPLPSVCTQHSSLLPPHCPLPLSPLAAFPPDCFNDNLGRHGRRRVLSADSSRDNLSLLPEALALRVFSFLDPRDIASKCALVSTSWSKLARAQCLWKGFCSPWGLTEADSRLLLGGWKGLYGAVFGTNLIQSPHFERLHVNEQADGDELLRPFEATASIYVERLASDGEHEPGFRCKSHWTDDVDEETLAPNGANGVSRTNVQTDGADAPCSPDLWCGTALALQQPARGCTAIRTSVKQRGQLKQTISLSMFPDNFLDASAPIQLSAWVRSNFPLNHGLSKFRLQLALLSQDGSTLHHWDSHHLEITSSKWQSISTHITDYPKGLRSLVIKVAGQGVDFTKVNASFIFRN